MKSCYKCGDKKDGYFILMMDEPNDYFEKHGDYPKESQWYCIECVKKEIEK